MEKRPTVILLKPVIVSGGQTGVDRAALAWAISHRFAHGGWCPKGRRAEDGKIPARFKLRETKSGSYSDRTKRNVKDSDATLIIVRGKPTGGTALTERAALRMGKPFFVAKIGESPAEMVRLWLMQNVPAVLNVAGPRESGAPGIGRQTRRYLSDIFRDVRFVLTRRQVPRPGKNGRRRLVGPKGANRAG